MLGINIHPIVIYQAELIYLRNDGKTAKEIALLLGTKSSTVVNWYTKGSQPKEYIIDKLEDMLFKRIDYIKK